MKKLGTLQVLVPALMLSSVAHAGIVMHAFAPSAYNPDTAAMDAALGIAGYHVENFEDTTLIDGLSYTLSNPDGGTFTSLPAVYDTASHSATVNNQWDGSHILLGNEFNSITNEGARANNVVFTFAGGARSFGVGLSNFQSLDALDFAVTDHDLYVNGQLFGRLETLLGDDMIAGRIRNAYIRIDATDGDVIESVEFRNVNTTGVIDLLAFDHVAVDPVPAPAGLVVLGAGFLASSRRRRR